MSVKSNRPKYRGYGWPGWAFGPRQQVRTKSIYTLCWKVTRKPVPARTQEGTNEQTNDNHEKIREEKNVYSLVVPCETKL